MATLRILKTHLRMSLGGIEEHEVEALIGYWCTPAWPPSHDDPGSDALVEIDTIRLIGDNDTLGLPAWMVDPWRHDEVLIADCMEDWADDMAAAEEARADARRDDLMMERF